MEFITHTVSWIKGEIFEATIIGIFGLLVFFVGISLWMYSSTPNGKSMTLPMIVVGIIFLSSGISMYFSNQKRLVEYQKSFEQNSGEFIQQEKRRIEGFQYLYTVSKVLATIGFLVTMIAFWFTKSSAFQGIALGLALFGLSSIVIDYFSEERAKIYYEQILNQPK